MLNLNWSFRTVLLFGIRFFGIGTVGAFLSGCEGQFKAQVVEAPVLVSKAESAPVIVSLRASPGSIERGQSTQLEFSVEGATSLKIDSTISIPANSTSYTVSPTSTKTYQLTAINSVGSVSQTVEVTVTVPPPPPPPATAPVISSFSASPSSVPSGSAAVLTFGVTGATSLKLDPGSINITGRTSYTVNPTANTTYTLTAMNSAGSVTRTTAVTVTPVAETPFCTSPLPLATRGKVKFQPGHYVAIGGGGRAAARLTATLNEIRTPAFAPVTGVLKRYYWSDLQPSRDVFDFTKIRNDIAEVTAAGKKLSIMVMWKFMSDTGTNPVPAFLGPLTTGSGYPYQYRLNADGDHANGFIAYLGNPIVVRELVRFLGRLATEVDTSNTVASIVFAESAMGLKRENFTPPMSLADFNSMQDRHVDGLLEVNKQATCLFKHTPIIQLTNAPIRRLPEIIPQYVNWSISMGGPDVWWKDAGQDRVYDLFPIAQGKVGIGMIIAGGNYLYDSHAAETIPLAERTPYRLNGPNYGWTANQTVINLAQKAKTELKANYIFWKKNGDGGDPYYQAFKQEIVKMGTSAETIRPVNKDCPSNYAGQCVVNLP